MITSFIEKLPQFFLYSLLGFLFIFLQSSFLPGFLPLYLVPNLLFILIIYISFKHKSHFGAFLCFMIGIYLDLSKGIWLGPWAGAFTISFLLIFIFSQKFYFTNFILILGMAFFAVIISNIAYALLTFNLPRARIFNLASEPSWNSMFIVLFLEALITALLTPFVLKVFSKFLGNYIQSNAR